MKPDPKVLDDLAQRLTETLPVSLSGLRKDLENNFRAVLQAGLARLDLVTRQEFDVQAGVLRRTRERLEQLDRRLKEFEKGASR